MESYVYYPNSTVCNKFKVEIEMIIRVQRLQSNCILYKANKSISTLIKMFKFADPKLFI